MAEQLNTNRFSPSNFMRESLETIRRDAPPKDEEQGTIESFFDAFKSNANWQIPPSGKLKDANRSDSNLEYLTTQAQLGLTEGNAILGALAETAVQTFGPGGDVNVADILQNSLFGEQGEYSVNNPKARTMREIPQYFGQAIDRWSTKSQEAYVNAANSLFEEGITDYRVTLPNKNLRPPTDSSAVLALGSGMRLASDPITYLGTPVKLGALATRAIGSTAVGTEINLLGQGGNWIEETTFDSDTGIGETLGQSLGLVTGSNRQAFIEKLVGGTSNVVKKQGGKVLNTLLNRPVSGADAATNQASGAAKRLLRITAQGTPIEKLDEIVSEFALLGKRLDRESFPILVGLGDNPFIREEVTRLAKNNPNFRSQVATELSNLRKEIEVNATNVFGTRYARIAPIGELSQSAVDKLEGVRRARIEVDNKITEASINPNPSLTAEEQGKVVTNLIASRERLAKYEMTPHYMSLMLEATKGKIKLPREGVERLYNVIIENNVRDIFGKGTTLDNKILKHLKPKKETVEKIDFTTGTKTTSEKKVFPEMSFYDVDSLKRAINGTKRGQLTGEGRMKLSQLEGVFKEVRELIPSGFSQKLQDLDYLYWEKVGVPFGEQGIKDLTSKKYSEQVIPVLLKNNKVVDDFLGVTGSEGVPIVRDAILTDMYKTVFKTGEFNARAYKQWELKRKEQIKHVPGLGEQVNKIRFDSDELYKEIDRLDGVEASIQSELSNNYFKAQKGTSSFGSKYYAEGAERPDYYGLVGDITKDKSKAAQFFQSLNGLDPTTKESILESTRREMLEYTKSNGGVPFLLNPRNKDILNRLMGESYQTDLIELTKLTEAMQQADVATLAFNVSNSLGAKIKIGPGEIDVAQVSSLQRRPIIGTTQKILILGLKYWESVVNGATDASIEKLLLSPDGMAEVAKLNKERKSGEFNKNHLEEFIKIAQKYRLIGAYDITKERMLNEE